MAGTEAYSPGVCNIGDDERALRRTAGWLGVALSAAIVVAFVELRIAGVPRLVLLLPSSLAAVGFMQSRAHFCANFGMRGLYNFGGVGAASRISDADSRRRDRAAALRIIAYSLAIGSVVSLLFLTASAP